MRENIFQKSELCISIAKKPGVFGTIIHNAGYKALGLNYTYKAFATEDLGGAIRGVRALGIKGCSVSMPYKEKVIKFIDKLDSSAKKIKAVNTIVNNNGILIGFNTDVISLKKQLKKYNLGKNSKVLVIGAGGMSKAILVSLQELKMKNIQLTNRTSKKGKKIANEFNLEYIEWRKRNSLKSDIIINATSVGMYPKIEEVPINEDMIKRSQIVVDAISNPIQTKLIKLAKKYKKNTVLGGELAFHQAVAQFKLYTNRNPPIKEMEKAVEKYYYNKK